MFTFRFSDAPNQTSSPKKQRPLKKSHPEPNHTRPPHASLNTESWSSPSQSSSDTEHSSEAYKKLLAALQKPSTDAVREELNLKTDAVDSDSSGICVPKYEPNYVPNSALQEDITTNGVAQSESALSGTESALFGSESALFKGLVEDIPVRLKMVYIDSEWGDAFNNAVSSFVYNVHLSHATPKSPRDLSQCHAKTRLDG